MRLDSREVAYSSMFAAFLAIGAFIKIPISIVPITLQTLVIVLASLLLSRKVAVLSVCLYIGIGLLGVPILANGGGPMYVLQPTFGYLIGFIVSTWLISTLCKKSDNMIKQVTICLIGVAIIYVCGMLYFVLLQYVLNDVVFDLSWVLFNLCLVFLPGDILSAIFAIFIAKRLMNIKMWK